MKIWISERKQEISLYGLEEGLPLDHDERDFLIEILKYWKRMKQHVNSKRDIKLCNRLISTLDWNEDG